MAPTKNHAFGRPRAELPMTPDELQDPYLRKTLPPEIQDPLVYCMLLLGAASVFTWAIIYMDVDNIHRIFPAEDAEHRLAAAYKVSTFLVGCLGTIFGPRYSFRSRIVPAFGVQAVCVLALLVVSEIGGRADHLILCLMATAGGAQAISQGSLTALCSTCPERYMRSFVVGLGASALLVSTLKVTAKTLYPEALTCERMFLAVLFCMYMLAIFCYMKIVDTDISIRVCAQMARDDAERRPLSDPRSSYSAGAVYGLADYRRVLSSVGSVLALMVANWAISCSVFPGMSADLDSSSQAFQQSGWYHILLMLTFVVFDVIGRSLTAFFDLSATQLTVFTVMRFVFVPGFLLINKFDGHHQAMDVVTFIFMALLAMSNGFAVSMCSVMPIRVVETSEREMAGSLGFLSYIGGQSLGVMVALTMKVSGVVPEF